MGIRTHQRQPLVDGYFRGLPVPGRAIAPTGWWWRAVAVRWRAHSLFRRWPWRRECPGEVGRRPCHPPGWAAFRPASQQRGPGLGVALEKVPAALACVALLQPLDQPVHAAELDLGDIVAEAALQPPARQADKHQQQGHQQKGQGQEEFALEGQAGHGLEVISGQPRRVCAHGRGGGPSGCPDGRAASTPLRSSHTPCRVSPRRPVKLTWSPADLPWQAAMASGGGDGGWPSVGGAGGVSAAWAAQAAHSRPVASAGRMR